MNQEKLFSEMINITLNIGINKGYNPVSMYGTQTKFNSKKRMTLYDQNGKKWWNFGSRQSKRHQSQKQNDNQYNNNKW